MKRWTNGFDTFETEEEAWDNCREKITWDNIEHYFEENMTFHEFFTRCRDAIPDFFDAFEDEYCNAENDYFSRNYEEYDENEGE